MDGTEKHDAPDSVVYQKEAACLGEIATQLSIVFAATPIVSSAILEHVFQALVQQFYESGVCYLPNFGWMKYVDGKIVFSPSNAMKVTLERMEKSLECCEFSFGCVDLRLEKQLGGEPVHHHED